MAVDTENHVTDRPPSPRHRGLRAIVNYALAQTVAHLALGLAVPLLLWRARKEPAHLAGIGERFGLGPAGPQGAIWVYAASLGETRAVSPLIRHLVDAGHQVLLTHLSPAGLAEGARLFGSDPRVHRRYVPLDLFWAMRLFLARARPRALLVCEIEIWPAMLTEASRAAVPRVMVNGNLLPESLRPGRWPLSILRRWVLGHYRLFDHVFTRTDAYAARYQGLGVAPERISVVGELKYDQWIDPAQPARGERLRTCWPADAPVLMIASSVADEEPALLDLIAGLMRRPGLGTLRVIWAPRSPQRFDAVAAALEGAGLNIMRRSAMGPDLAGPLPEESRVLLGDSIGEMNIWYPMADLVFVGASLNGDGGHNIMEPMALGRPVVMGPSIYGIAFAAEPAAQIGAFESLPDVAALEDRIAALLTDPAALARMSAAAARFAARQTGAARRTLDGLKPWIGQP